MRKLVIAAAALVAAVGITGVAVAITNGSGPTATAIRTSARCSRRRRSPTAPGWMHRNADLADRVPHRRALRRGREPRRGHVRLSYHSATGTTYWGTWHANPNYSKAQSDPDDIAVVVLDTAVRGSRRRGCRAGSLEPRRSATRSRRSATARTRSRWAPAAHLPLRRHPLRRDRLGQLHRPCAGFVSSMNPSTGDGGTCYGDSGGPNFLGPRTSSPAPRSLATSSAARRTSTTGSIPRRRETSSGTTWRFRRYRGLSREPCSSHATATTAALQLQRTPDDRQVRGRLDGP